jgi:hypothetical protein
MVVGFVFGTPCGVPAVESLVFDGANFGALYTSSNPSSIRFARLNEMMAFTTQPVNASVSQAEFWASWDGTNFGLTYPEAINGGRLAFRRISTAGAVVSEDTGVSNSDGTPERSPNVHPNGNNSGHTILYTSGTQVRCVRLDANGFQQIGSDVEVLDAMNMPVFPINGPLVASVFRPTNNEIIAVYQDPTAGLFVRRINPLNCVALAPTGQPRVPPFMNGSNIRAADNYQEQPPTIAFNGLEFAIAYDVRLAGNVRNVGVLLLDANLTPIFDYTIGVGDRPSITWAGDRWAVRYRNTGAGNIATVAVGSMQGAAVMLPPQ